MPNSDNSSRTTVLMDRFILSLSGIVTVLTLGWVLWYCRFGIDFTDESFYLVWMANPFNYSVSASQFGFIYHPLFDLLAGNISAVRQVNLLITFSLSWVLSYVFLKSVYGNTSLQNLHRMVLSAAVASASLASCVFAGLWLPTPSYNSLALQSLLIAATGMLLADRQVNRISVTGWFLIGAGGWLAFMAKPTTAAALGLCSGLYLLLADKLRIRLFMITVATAVSLVILAALAIDGSILVFVDRLKISSELAKLLGGHSIGQLVRLDEFTFDRREKIILFLCTTVIFAAAILSQARRMSLRYGGASLCLIFALVSMATILDVSHKAITAGRFLGLLLWPVPIASVLICVMMYRLKGLLLIPRPLWATAVIFFVFPHVYAFGTSNNYWVSAGLAGLFWILAGLVFLSPHATSQRFTALLLPIVLGIQMITVTLVHSGMETPYRQPQPLRDNDYSLEIGRSGSMLVLSKGFASYLNKANDLAKQSGLKKGTPMIDMTGQSPGILYALGASNIGQAWMIGGYPGSDALAVASLQRVSCRELASAWLLAEPEGPIKLSSGILSSFGANIAADFEIVGTFKTAEGSGGYKTARVQQLLKPLRSDNSALAACIAVRQVTK